MSSGWICCGQDAVGVEGSQEKPRLTRRGRIKGNGDLALLREKLACRRGSRRPSRI